MSVLTYCADLENEGRIGGAESWSDEEWLTTCGLRPGDVAEGVASGLLEWDGPDLVCGLYDHHGAQALQTKRAQAQHGKKGALNDHNARLRAAKLARQQDPPPMGVPPGPPQSIPVQSIPDQGEGTLPPPPGEEHPAAGSHLAETLASLGAATTPDAIAEWHALLTGPLVRAETEDDQRAALRWMIQASIASGGAGRYVRDVQAWAPRWRERRAKRDLQPPESKAPEKTTEEIGAEHRARRRRGDLLEWERSAIATNSRHIAADGSLLKGPAPSDNEEPAA